MLRSDQSAAQAAAAPASAHLSSPAVAGAAGHSWLGGVRARLAVRMLYELGDLHDTLRPHLKQGKALTQAEGSAIEKRLGELVDGMLSALDDPNDPPEAIEARVQPAWGYSCDEAPAAEGVTQ